MSTLINLAEIAMLSYYSEEKKTHGKFHNSKYLEKFAAKTKIVIQQSTPASGMTM